MEAVAVTHVTDRKASGGDKGASRKIRVLVVGRFSLSRRALRLLLEQEGSFEVLGDVETADYAARAVAAVPPNVIVAETFERGDEGLDALTAIHRSAPGPRIVIVTTDPNHESCLRALRMGIAGYLLASADPAYLCRAIRAVDAGGTIVHSTLVPALISRLASQAGEREATLTSREIDVIRGLTEGLNDKQIAVRLSLAESTVKIHLRSVYQKLGLRNRAHAAAYAAANGLLDGHPSPP